MLALHSQLKRCSIQKLIKLREEFGQNCALRVDAKAPPLQEGPTQVTACYVARMCLCESSQKRRFAAFVKELMYVLKTEGVKGSSLRDWTAQGIVVLQLRQMRMPVVWLHLSFVNLTAWFAVVMQLDVETDPFLVRVAAAQKRLANTFDPRPARRETP